MADINKFLPKILQWEGGYVNDPIDHGGATNKGVTLATWRQVGYDKDGDGDIDADDVKMLTIADVKIVLKKFYWDRWRADEINTQSIAEILVDWVWGSGKWGIINPQILLNIKPDGIVGPVTIHSVNIANQTVFFNNIRAERIAFVNRIIHADPSQARFENGWKNRINSYKFVP